MVSATDDDLPDDVVEDVRLAVYRSLAGTGQVPDAGDLAAIAGDPDRARRAIRRLAADRAWGLDADGDIVLAHPFATRSFGFSVMSSTTLWWGGCCWDAFAIPHLVPGAAPSLIATSCPACDAALAWLVDDRNPPPGDERAHFLVPVARVWDDVVHTCSNQLLFCDDGCIDRWLAETGHHDGYRMDLATLWRLAAGWYEGRLERGYQRREPSAAADYFASVGLEGAFWGLEPDHRDEATP